MASLLKIIRKKTSKSVMPKNHDNQKMATENMDEC